MTDREAERALGYTPCVCAKLDLLAIPAGGLIAAGILWAMLRPPKE